MNGIGGFNRSGNFKADTPHATIVLRIPDSKVEMIKTLIGAYVDNPPTDELQLLLLELKRQLP
jgi:hypothetical protein